MTTTEVPAFEKLTTRIRLAAQVCIRPVPETITTPARLARTAEPKYRVEIGDQADVFGGCTHFVGIEESGDVVQILFEVGAQ